MPLQIAVAAAASSAAAAAVAIAVATTTMCRSATICHQPPYMQGTAGASAEQKTLLCIFSYITCIYDNILLKNIGFVAAPMRPLGGHILDRPAVWE